MPAVTVDGQGARRTSCNFVGKCSQEVRYHDVTLDQFWLWSMQAGKQTSLMASDAGALAQPLGRPVQDSETH